MAVPVQFVHMGLGLVLAALTLPLIARKVPMNRGYGIRMREAFLSEENWYALNEYGGKVLLAFGLFLLGFGLGTWRLAPPPTSPWAPVYLIVPLLGILPTALLIRRRAKRLPDREP